MMNGDVGADYSLVIAMTIAITIPIHIAAMTRRRIMMMILLAKSIESQSRRPQCGALY
jgi:ABC-type glycerol-3-phosphate transport system permease component